LRNIIFSTLDTAKNTGFKIKIEKQIKTAIRSGKRKAASGKRQAASGKRKAESGKRKAASE